MPDFTFYDYRKKLWSFKHAIRSVKLIRKRFDLVENSGSHWILWRPKQLREAIYIEYNWWAKIFPPLSFFPFEPHFDSAQISQKRYGTRSILNVEVLLQIHWSSIVSDIYFKKCKIACEFAKNWTNIFLLWICMSSKDDTCICFDIFDE